MTKTRHILILTKYSRNGGSSRIRTYQYLDELNEEFSRDKYHLQVQPLFSEKYLVRLYKGKSRFYEVIKGYFRRLHLVLFKLKNYEFIYIEKEMFPKLPKYFYYTLINSRIPYVVDYDDATFETVNSPILTKKYHYLLQNAKIVSCGNQYLEDRVKQLGAQNTIIIPSVINEKKYLKKFPEKREEALTIGWIGTPQTIHYLEDLVKILTRLGKRHQFKLITIGARLKETSESITGFGYEYFEWNESSEVENLNRIDIGIMPLRSGNWEKGKCAFKLIQYMACEIPVVASKISANIELLGNNENYGLLAKDDLEWENKIEQLIRDKKLRNYYGKVGKERIVSSYSLASRKNQFLSLFR